MLLYSYLPRLPFGIISWHILQFPPSFRKEVLMRLLLEIEMATIDSIVQLGTFSAIVLGV